MKITSSFELSDDSVELKFISSPGPGGQNVNKVATGVQLRFAINHPSLPEHVRKRLLLIAGKKVSRDGTLIIKAIRFRSQARNKQDAIGRFVNLIRWAAVPVKMRKKTGIPAYIKKQRLMQKKLRGKAKVLRSKVVSN